ncbi:MAG: hypothetical protein ACYC7F_04775 [Gemmatimonadaceae bacterium]
MTFGKHLGGEPLALRKLIELLGQRGHVFFELQHPSVQGRHLIASYAASLERAH